MSMSKVTITIAVALAALAALAAVQYQTIQQLRQENGDLKQQAAQVAPLQDKLASVSQEAAKAAAGPLSQAQVVELARLRNEVSQLRQQTNELGQARQQIQMLSQRAAAEAEARRSLAASAAALQASEEKHVTAINAMNACINNLRIIDSAKAQWALENHKQNTDTPTMDDLRPYIGRGPNGVLPTCPDGGAYTLGAVGEKPTCSTPTHVLP
jgi:DNA repair exonuclease SbcCD ATPase subunit